MNSCIRQGDCLEILKEFEDNSIDSVVTDPPAGIGFMGQKWDSDKGGRDHWIAWLQEIAAQCLRVIKPGGHAVVWSLPRTSHWTAMAWENAGFEVRDRIAHVFATGFPKSLDVSKAIDKAAKAAREVIGKSQFAARANIRTRALTPHGEGHRNCIDTREITVPATDAAKQWDGWGTSLKPAVEDYWIFRKPLSERTVAANVLQWGTGALNIAACRVGVSQSVPSSASANRGLKGYGMKEAPLDGGGLNPNVGRWPANLVTDGSVDVLYWFPSTKSKSKEFHVQGRSGGIMGSEGEMRDYNAGYDDSGSAARFYFCTKASVRERELGLEDDEKHDPATITDFRPTLSSDPENWAGIDAHPNLRTKKRANNHPTCKPLKLMRYLIKLVTPPDGLVLDPFAGSFTTGMACVHESFSFIGIEKEEDYVNIGRKRIIGAMKDTGSTSSLS